MVTKEDLRAILIDAYHQGYIIPDKDSVWGFQYTGLDEWLLSDGLFEMYKKPVLAFKYVDLINETGKEVSKELYDGN